MEATEPKKKRVRRSAKHSKTGCGTCKIRRVKCDEARPFCARCRSFGVTCDGWPPQVLPSRTRPLSQAPALLPKATTRQRLQSTSQSQSPNTLTFQTLLESVQLSKFIRVTPFENDNEAKYYNQWCTSTVHQVLPYCQYSMSSPMLSGACSEDSIRHALIALAALHEAAVTVQQSRSLSFDRLGLVANTHHRRAIEHYSKAVQIMRKAMMTGKHDIRTTLVACFVIFGFEAFHGNLSLALSQIQTGIALIEDWKGNYLQRVTSFPPDDEFIETFLTLEIQIIAFHDKRPYETHARLRTEYKEKVRSMTRGFNKMWEATKCFYLVKKQIDHFFRVAKRLVTEAGSGHSVERGRLLDEVRSYQLYHQAELNLWHEAFQLCLTKINPTGDAAADEDNQSRATWLRLHYIATSIALETVFATDEMVYDEYTAEFSEMISLSTVVMICVENRCSTTKWAFDISGILPLYFVGTKCRVSTIRRQALALLQGSPRREGIWDSVLIGKMVGWVQGIEEEMDGERVPGWARVEDLQSSFDLENRSVEVRCRQRLGEGLAFRERVAHIKW